MHLTYEEQSVETFLNILNNIGIVLFIVFFFGFCIFIHEFGHLLAAVWRGLHVDKFSIGFGKKLWGFKYHGIDFVISLLPLGGYVSIPQLDPTDKPKTEDGRELPFSTPLARAITAFAGPFFNILFGFALALVIWLVGVWQTPPSSSCVVTDVPVIVPVVGDEGVRPDEQIVRVNGVEVLGLQLKTGEYRGSLYDLCSFWEEFPATCELSAKEGAILHLDVINLKGEERTVDYAVKPNLEYEAGLRVGDRIIAFNGKPFRKGVDGLFEDHAYNEEQKATLTIKREGREPFDVAYVQRPNSRIEDLKIPFFQARNPFTIGDVLPNSPAAAAGLQVGDQLLSYNDRNMTGIKAFLDDVQELKTDSVSLLIARNCQEQTLQLQLPADRADLTFGKLGLAFIVTVKAVYQDTPAEQAGLEQYDRLIRLNGVEVTDGRTFSKTVRELKGAPLSLTVLRDGKELTFENIKAEIMDAQGKPAYLLGIQLDDTPPKLLAYPNPWEQFVEVFNKTARTLWLLFQPVTNFVLGREGTANVKLRHMSSFVGISAILWYQVKTEGIRAGLAFIILITFGLAFANLLPFPILDGGHILFAFIEFIIRRRLPPKFMNYLSNTFAGLLIALMLYITFNDIMRLKRINSAYSDSKPKLNLDTPATPVRPAASVPTAVPSQPAAPVAP